jgi:beta-xylosidase
MKLGALVPVALFNLVVEASLQIVPGTRFPFFAIKIASQVTSIAISAHHSKHILLERMLANYPTLSPGSSWTASNGHHIQAHGGGVIKVGGTYYWHGEDKTQGSAFQNVNCYSSTNLVDWTYVGAVLSRQSSGDLGPNRVVERPKVIFNKNTNQYVMWMHIDSSDYKEAKTGVATSSSVCGSYSYRGSFQPLGQQSRDMNLFVDDDGTGYLLTEDVSVLIFPIHSNMLQVHCRQED